MTKKYIYCIYWSLLFQKLTTNISIITASKSDQKIVYIDHYCLKTTKNYIDCIYRLLLSQKWPKVYLSYISSQKVTKNISIVYIDHYYLKKWPTNILIITASKSDQQIVHINHYCLKTTKKYIDCIYRLLLSQKVTKKVYLLYISITTISKSYQEYINYIYLSLLSQKVTKNIYLLYKSITTI